MENKRPLTPQEISAIVDGLHPIDWTQMELLAKMPAGKRIYPSLRASALFGGTFFGVTRAIHDIDLIVDLEEKDFEALSQKFPLPRSYADPEMIRNSVEKGMKLKREQPLTSGEDERKNYTMQV